jgi:hypothetical protein
MEVRNEYASNFDGMDYTFLGRIIDHEMLIEEVKDRGR